MKPHPVVAAFDFDGTLTRYDTLIPFLFFTFGKKITYRKMLGLLPQLLGFPFGFQTRQECKEIILSSFLRGFPLAQLQNSAFKFAQGPLFKLIKPEAWARYQWHRSQGHTCVLVSANLDLFLAPFAKQTGFDHLIASEIEVNEERLVTGSLKGKNCWGAEKAHRLLHLLGPKENYLLYVYGDSRGDKELLKLADYPYYRKFS